MLEMMKTKWEKKANGYHCRIYRYNVFVLVRCRNVSLSFIHHQLFPFTSASARWCRTSPDGSKGALRENSWAENVKYETEYVAATDCYSALTEEKPRRSAEGIAKTIHDWFTECSVLTVCVKSHIVRGFDVLVQFFGPIEGMGSW